MDSGARTLKDAINEAMRDWVTNVRTTHYLLGSVLGAHPYPMMVRDFQSVIGDEARAQFLGQAGGLPDLLVACVGGGSNAIGLFYAFLADPVEMVGVEAGGRSPAARRPCGALPRRRRGGGRAARHAHLPAAGRGRQRAAHPLRLRRPRLSGGRARARAAARRGPGRATTSPRDDEALAAFHLLAETEGIIPALESSHALAWVLREARGRSRGKLVIVNLSGRGDKDLGACLDETARHERGSRDRLARGDAAAGARRFVAFLTAGDPSLERTVEVALGLDDGGRGRAGAGRAVLRSRWPTGPVIQRASERALAPRRHARGRARRGARASARRSELPARALQLLQPAPPLRPASGWPATRARRAWTACSSPTCRRRKPETWLDAARARPGSTPSSWPRPPARTSGCAAWRRPRAGSCTR